MRLPFIHICRPARVGLILSSVISALACPAVQAQEPPQELTQQERKAAVDTVATLLDQHYVFPEVATQLQDLIRSNFEEGLYADLDSEEAFCKRLTADLRSINNDRHLMLYPTPESAASNEDHYSAELLRSRGAAGNFGFTRAEILEGNVGLLALSNFSLDELYYESCLAADASMAFLTNVDALIVDLRNNPGGGARLNRYLSSYFFEAEPVHLNTYYFRSNDFSLEYWTLDDIAGTRLPEVPLYILIDSDTFSSAESFAYNLKHLGRATVVGESSGGGSHGGTAYPATAKFRAFIPFSRSIHPMTGGDFEGVGVQPDIAVESAAALTVAHAHAMAALGVEPAKPTWSQSEVKSCMRERAHTLLQAEGVHSVSIGVFRDGQTSLGHFGELDPGHGNPPNDQTIYSIASVTKTMTGLLTAQAVRDQLLTPESDIRDYLRGDFPNLEFQGQPIRVRHLLTHTSQLPAEIFGVEEFLSAGDFPGALEFAAQYTKTDFFRDLRAFELSAAPGSGYRYSSNGTNLMGYILEAVCEKPFADLLDEFIFSPANMANTAFELNAEQRSHLANGYDGQGRQMPEQPRFLLGADGYLKSNLADLVEYMRFMLAGDNQMARESWREISQSGAPMGYFWQIEPGVDRDLVKHAGTAIGTTSWIVLDPKSRLGVVLIISSRFQGSNELLYAAAIDLIETLYD